MASRQQIRATLRLTATWLPIGIVGTLALVNGVMNVSQGNTAKGTLEIATWVAIGLAIALYKFGFRPLAGSQNADE
jgi:hypothetical protein